MVIRGGGRGLGFVRGLLIVSLPGRLGLPGAFEALLGDGPFLTASWASSPLVTTTPSHPGLCSLLYESGSVLPPGLCPCWFLYLRFLLFVSLPFI